MTLTPRFSTDWERADYEREERGETPLGPMVGARTERGPIEHELKTWQSYFHAIESGKKLFEIRRDDRDFRVGDTLRLRETESASGAYTGREAHRTITYILRHGEDFGLMDGFAVLSIVPIGGGDGR